MKIRKSRDLVIVVVTIIGTLVSALGVEFVTSYLTEKIWIKHNVVEQQRAILQKRIDLIERTSKIINSTAKYSTYNNIVKFKYEMASKFEDCMNLHVSVGDKECQKIYNIGKLDDLAMALNAKIERENLNTEYAVVMQLNALYFGDKTKKILREICGVEWWSLNPDKFKSLLSAMNEELSAYPL